MNVKSVLIISQYRQRIAGYFFQNSNRLYMLCYSSYVYFYFFMRLCIAVVAEIVYIAWLVWLGNLRCSGPPRCRCIIYASQLIFSGNVHCLTVTCVRTIPAFWTGGLGRRGGWGACSSTKPCSNHRDCAGEAALKGNGACDTIHVLGFWVFHSLA